MSLFSPLLLLLLSLPPLVAVLLFSDKLGFPCALSPFFLCPNRCQINVRQSGGKWQVHGNMSIARCAYFFSLSQFVPPPFFFSSFPSTKWLTQIWKWHPSAAPAAWTSWTSLCANYRLATLWQLHPLGDFFFFSFSFSSSPTPSSFSSFSSSVVS